MKANESERRVKRVSLMVLIVLFAAASAQAAEGCKTAEGKVERAVPRTPAIALSAEPSDAAPSVLDNIPQVSKSDRPLGPYLALHCEAVSRLFLGEATRAYHGPACAQGENERAVR